MNVLLRASACRRTLGGSVAARVWIALTGLLAALTIGVAPPAHAALTCQDNVALNVAAHEDDDVLFMSPDVHNDLAAGRCSVTVFVTAGDAGLDQAYWMGREAGARAATAHMTGVSDTWTSETVQINGQAVLEDTLVDRPSVALLFLRLPDGHDGTGYPITGGESLQRLWQSAIPAIHAIDGSATYSRESLIATLTAIMTTFRPTVIRTHDYVSPYDSGDHSDHQTVGYLVRAAHYRYGYPHQLTGYRGYGVSDLPSNLSQSDATEKLATFLAYAPHDPEVCQSDTECLASVCGPWFSREYTVGSEFGGVQNAARLGSVTASSQSSATGQSAAKAVDGVVAGYPGGATNEWATVGGRAGSWLQVAWSNPNTVQSVVLYDRPNLDDQVTAGTLLFSDGSTVPVGALPNDGSAMEVRFAPRRVTSVRFRVDAVSGSTHNIGLAELQAFTTNVAPLAAVTASSENAATGQTAQKVTDGYALGYPTAPGREWATVGGRSGSWLNLQWTVPVGVSRVVLYDRPNSDDQVTAGMLRFSDGSSVPVGVLPNGGAQLVVSFPARTVTSVRFEITGVSATTRNVGLTELQVETG